MNPALVVANSSCPMSGIRNELSLLHEETNLQLFSEKWVCSKLLLLVLYQSVNTSLNE